MGRWTKVWGQVQTPHSGRLADSAASPIRRNARSSKSHKCDFDEGNHRAAAIILADPERYAGLPLMWAQRWVARKGVVEVPLERHRITPEERLARYDERQRKKRIARRRDRWNLREWRISRKGNPFTRLKRIHIVVYQRKPSEWMVRITDLDREQSMVWQTTYPSCDKAKAGAFDALLWVESRRAANPALVRGMRFAR
jgi:hypothetical protein